MYKRYPQQDPLLKSSLGIDCVLLHHTHMASSLVASLAIAQRTTILYVDTAVFILGSVGSILNILLFCRKNLRTNSCCTYFLASSCAALVLLSMGIIPLVYALFNSVNPFFSINAFCKIRVYVNQWSAMSCRWLLVMACIDRGVACSTHVNIRQYFTVNKARAIALATITIWMIFPVHTLIFANIVPPGNIGCIVTDNSVAIYHGIYTIIMGGTLPPLVMIICTLSIRRSLKIKNERMVPMNAVTGDRRKKFRDQQVLIILLSQVAIFVISTIPFMTNNLYSTLTRSITNKPPDRRAIEGYAQVITELFVYVFPASTFYGNTLVSQTFRQELLLMFRQVVLGNNRRRSRVTPITLTRSNRTNNGTAVTTGRTTQASIQMRQIEVVEP